MGLPISTHLPSTIFSNRTRLRKNIRPFSHQDRTNLYLLCMRWKGSAFRYTRAMGCWTNHLPGRIVQSRRREAGNRKRNWSVGVLDLYFQFSCRFGQTMKALPCCFVLRYLVLYKCRPGIDLFGAGRCSRSSMTGFQAATNDRRGRRSDLRLAVRRRRL